MRAVWLDVPEWFLEERRKLGHDKKDEVWDGVIHMVPPPAFVHGSFGLELIVAMRPIAARRGLYATSDNMGLFDPIKPVKNFRIPDGALSRPEHRVERGLIGAELVIEILSPNDESRDKFDFYAAREVREVWICDPKSRETEVYALVDGSYVLVGVVEPAAKAIRSPALDIELSIIDGPLLRIVDDDHTADI
jgi:Uma2 family endonuclease